MDSQLVEVDGGEVVSVDMEDTTTTPHHHHHQEDDDEGDDGDFVGHLVDHITHTNNDDDSPPPPTSSHSIITNNNTSGIHHVQHRGLDHHQIQGDEQCHYQDDNDDIDCDDDDGDGGDVGGEVVCMKEEVIVDESKVSETLVRSLLDEEDAPEDDQGDGAAGAGVGMDTCLDDLCEGVGGRWLGWVKLG